MLADHDASVVSFLLLPLPGVTLLPFAGFVDKLRFSADDEDQSRQRYCQWQVAGLSDRPFLSSSGVQIIPDVAISSALLGDLDYLVIFGCQSTEAARNYSEALRSFIRQAIRRHVHIAVIDNASFTLAEAGFLNNKQVCVHWRHRQEFRQRYPAIAVMDNNLFFTDGLISSCAGGTGAIDLAVELIAKKAGRENALKGLADMMVDEARNDQHLLKSIAVSLPPGQRLHRAIALMRSWLSADQNIEDIALHIGVSRRQMDRLFQNSFGVTAHAYWQEMRLQYVSWRLLNSSAPVRALAMEVGMQEQGYLNRLFRQRFGCSPSAYRQAGGAIVSETVAYPSQRVSEFSEENH